MALSDRLDHFQRRHPAAAFPLAVVYKYVDDSGGYLAALVAYYGFVSLFPLLLLLSTVLGLVLVGHPQVQQELLSSALRQFPVVGDQLGDPKRLGGGTRGLVIGIVGSLYGGLGVAQAVQYGMNTAWRVPRNNRPNPFKARGRSLLLLAVIGLAVVGTTALSTLGSTGAASLGMAGKIAVLAASVLVNCVVFVVAFRIATARDLTVGQVAPGAVLAAVLWQLLQTFGVLYVDHVVRDASATNGVFAIVLGLLAFLYLAAVIGLFCVEINVVRVERLYPRSLLTPFTDEVTLTPADEAAYAGQAQAQRSKSFEEVAVRFHPRPRRRKEKGGPPESGDPPR